MARKSGKEWKIGLIVVIAIVILVFGLKFMIGKKIFSSVNNYYTYYSNIQGLQVSSDIQVSGMTVGRVSAIELQPNRKVKVSFTTKNGLKIPKGSFAKLSANGLISGSKMITLHLSDSNVYYKNNTLIPSKDYSGLFSSLTDNVSPLLSSVQHAIVTLDTLISSINNLFNTDFQQHLSNSMTSLDKSLANLSDLSYSLSNQSNHLASVIENVNSITTNLKNNNDNITQTLNNLNDFSSKLNKAKIDETLASLNETSNNLDTITQKINSQKGSLGKLVNDKELYDNLSKSLNSLNALLKDLKKHPAKYINVSVFGRKAK